MKKYLIIGSLLAFACMAFAPARSQAQVTSLVSTNNGLTKDTVTNTGVRRLTTKVVGYRATIGIQVDVTKISGTLGGTLIPVASNDGVTWYAAGSGTMTITDVASQGILFTPPLGYQYYGVQWTGTGTMAGSFVAKLLARRSTD